MASEDLAASTPASSPDCRARRAKRNTAHDQGGSPADKSSVLGGTCFLTRSRAQMMLASLAEVAIVQRQLLQTVTMAARARAEGTPMRELWAARTWTVKTSIPDGLSVPAGSR